MGVLHSLHLISLSPPRTLHARGLDQRGLCAGTALAAAGSAAMLRPAIRHAGFVPDRQSDTQYGTSLAAAKSRPSCVQAEQQGIDGVLLRGQQRCIRVLQQ